ncbi:uncharacterized protein LOC130590181 [Beta vulgaris subsp. vulgaris]|uniref:uncharacterized protein LOC130590181 n=1 Tax=Beta vulgaris subsp. vulgaris TaxID=3555 RepID=UPI0025492101|nr:uncharacterized protein LOC130590181 [Beta vulgaris subsp. vulgaris]
MEHGNDEEELVLNDSESEKHEEHEEHEEQQQPEIVVNSTHFLHNNSRCHVANRLQQVAYTKFNGIFTIPQGAIKKIAIELNTSRWTIGRIWKKLRQQLQEDARIDVNHRKTGRVGRKRIQLDPQRLMAIPLRKRTTIRATAASLGIHRSTLHRLVKRGAIKKHTNAIKPHLTPAHKIARVLWCLGSIIPNTIQTIPKFSNMYNLVHVDEKWFCMSKISQRYYLAPGETEPYRRCKSKRFIVKVMFIAALARPHIALSGEVSFDGKIGIFPFIEEVAAKRSSCNRDAGVIETKAQLSITKDVIREKLINHILPSIRNKWPDNGCKQIWIVQDNARPHIASTDEQFMLEAQKDGFDIRLINQPAQSPDMNVLDLGFFNAIQTLKDQIAPRSVKQLVKAVNKAFDNYDPKLCNHIWLTLQQVMKETLIVKGNNNYHIPHMGKKSLERRGELPTRFISPQLVEESRKWAEEGHLEDDQEEANYGDEDSDDGLG